MGTVNKNIIREMKLKKMHLLHLDLLQQDKAVVT